MVWSVGCTGSPADQGQIAIDAGGSAKILRQGARRPFGQAVEAEVEQWIAEHAHLIDERGHRQVVRNGHAHPRKVVTGLGPIELTMPRVHDRRNEPQRERFTSSILPLYLRKAKSVEQLIPWLYLKGVSTSDFTEALAALLGPDCPGLSASTVTRLKQVWEEEYRQWAQRDLSSEHYVYLWADGVHFNVRLEEDRQCILVLMGATAEGKKELIAIADGYRESEQSWKSLLLDVKQRGLTVDPSLATGDGALGFWKALPQVFPTTRTQRCWVHKTANMLNKLPKRLHTDKTKGCGSRIATLTMVFKLAESVEPRFRRLNGHDLIGDVIAGIRFTDGVKQQAA